MKLLFSTRHLEVGGRPVDGFPLLIDDECMPFQPAQNFLLHALLESSSTRSKLTWEAVGRRLYDYFAFLNANGLAWDQTNAPVGASPLNRYRDWSAGELKLAPRTINKRIALVVRFYEWAYQRGYIASLPFSYRQIRAHGKHGMLAHVKTGGATVERASVLLREYRSPIKFLTTHQVQVCRQHLDNPSHRLLFELMLQSGLRSCEARTFPAKYVFDPAGRKDLVSGQVIRVDLSPRDLSIKFERPRTVDVPWRLMEELNAYKNLERALRKSRGGGEPDALVLTGYGSEMARTSVVGLFGELRKKVGFPVTAHMLRHTYATYTLAALRRKPTFMGEPLLYVRDRLGHSDVQTTAEYLHLINQLEAQLVLAHEDFIDDIFDLETGT
ncbi:MAG: site-specific integrase [Hyphomicrobiales bacterium]|nr:MAG: site-specific integrase [Hyphomicrobiales bacterium]